VFASLAVLAPGAVLFVAGSFAYYALRGPDIAIPRSPAGVLVALAAIFVLGFLARLAAVAFAWGVGQFWTIDIFQDRAPHELVDDLSARRLSPELRDELAQGVKSAFGLELPRIGRGDDEAVRDRKARALDEIVALAHAHAGKAAPARLAALEARVDTARGVAAALLAAAALILAMAAHDFFFAHEIAHAFSTFSIVALGIALGFSGIAAIGWARSQARRLALFVLLLVATERAKTA
jgi:hypothetical protein